MMIQHSSDQATDPDFANLVEELNQALDRGEEVNIEDFASEHPEHADDLRRVWPAMEVMRQLNSAEFTLKPGGAKDGQSVNGRDGHGGSSIHAHRERV